MVAELLVSDCASVETYVEDYLPRYAIFIAKMLNYLLLFELYMEYILEKRDMIYY